MRVSRIAVAMLLALVSTRALAQEKIGAKNIKAVRFGKLWDAKGKVWTNAIVLVDGEKIRTVTTDVSAIPASAEIIDLSKYTGLPGLIDAHTHMTFYTDETPGVPMLKQMANLVPAVEVAAGFEPPPHDDAGALGQAPRACLLGQSFSQPTEHGDAVPVGRVHPFAVVDGTFAVVRCDSAGDDHLAVRGIAHLRIDAEVSYER